MTTQFMYASESTKQLLRNPSYGLLGEVKGYDKLEKLLEKQPEIQMFPLEFALTAWGESLQRQMGSAEAIDLGAVISDVSENYTQQILGRSCSRESLQSLSEDHIKQVANFMYDQVPTFQPFYVELGNVFKIAAQKEQSFPITNEPYRFEALKLDRIDSSYKEVSSSLQAEIKAQRKAPIGSQNLSLSGIPNRTGHGDVSHQERAQMSPSRISLQSPDQPRHRTAVAQNESDIIHNTHTTSVEVSAKKRNPLETTIFVQLVEDIKGIKQALDGLKEQPVLAPNGSQPKFEMSRTPAAQNTPARMFGKGTDGGIGMPSEIKKPATNHIDAEDSMVIEMRDLKSPSKERIVIAKNFDEIKAKVEQFQGMIEKMQQATERLTSGLESVAGQGPRAVYQANKTTDALTEALQSLVKYFEQLPAIESKRVETQAHLLQISREDAEFDRACKEAELHIAKNSNQLIQDFLGKLTEAAGKSGKEPKNLELPIKVTMVKRQVLDMKKKALEAHLSALLMISSVVKRDVYGVTQGIKKWAQEHTETVRADYQKVLEDLKPVSKQPSHPRFEQARRSARSHGIVGYFLQQQVINEIWMVVGLFDPKPFGDEQADSEPSHARIEV